MRRFDIKELNRFEILVGHRGGGTETGWNVDRAARVEAGAINGSLRVPLKRII